MASRKPRDVNPLALYSNAVHFISFLLSIADNLEFNYGRGGGQDSIRRVRAPVKVLLESPEFFRTLGTPETNGIFPSCFQTFSLSLLAPALSPFLNRRREEEEEEEGPIGSSCHSLPVTYECRKFSTDASLPLDRNPPFYRAVKSLVIPRFISENTVLLEIYWIVNFFFFFFRSEGNDGRINIFRKLEIKRETERENCN